MRPDNDLLRACRAHERAMELIALFLLAVIVASLVVAAAS
ncbi:MAG: hypothetical protein ACRYG5_09955 [Janthinobacterium lividum]